MISLESVLDYVVMLMVATACGALGGFVFELLQSRGRGGHTGVLELPKGRERNAFYDLGWGASVILGATAAVAVLYFFPPTLTIQAGGTTVTKYDLVSLVALSLIVGSAGGGILEAAQKRVLAAVNAQKARTTEAVAKIQMEQLSKVAASETERALSSALASIQPRLYELLDEAERETPSELHTHLHGVTTISDEARTYLQQHPPTVVGAQTWQSVVRTFDQAANDAIGSFQTRMNQQLQVAQSALASSTDEFSG